MYIVSLVSLKKDKRTRMDISNTTYPKIAHRASFTEIVQL